MYWTTSPKTYRTQGSGKILRPDEIVWNWDKRVRFSARGWLWIKLRKGANPRVIRIPEDLHRGQGQTTGKNAEDVMLFKRGSPPVRSRAEFELVFYPIRDHSQKPPMHEKIETFAHGPYVELFARSGSKRRGWEFWGDEIGKFNDR